MADDPNSLTTDQLRTLVLDHVLEQLDLFIPQNEPEPAKRMLKLLDSLNSLAMNIATTSIVNRQNLSPLPTFAGQIDPDPENDASGNRYELRYRLVEQIGSNAPHVDKLYTYDEAVADFDENFVDRYWGRLGENCPRSVTGQGDRRLWFTIVRYPVASPTNDQSDRASSVARPRR